MSSLGFTEKGLDTPYHLLVLYAGRIIFSRKNIYFLNIFTIKLLITFCPIYIILTSQHIHY
jgi:hypothetical protein